MIDGITRLILFISGLVGGALGWITAPVNGDASWIHFSGFDTIVGREQDYIWSKDRFDRVIKHHSCSWVEYERVIRGKEGEIILVSLYSSDEPLFSIGEHRGVVLKAVPWVSKNGRPVLLDAGRYDYRLVASCIQDIGLKTDGGGSVTLKESPVTTPWIAISISPPAGHPTGGADR